MIIVAAATILFVQTPSKTNVQYCEVDGQKLTMNVFLPPGSSAGKPSPAMVDIHGGWFMAGEAASTPPDVLMHNGIAFFSINYRRDPHGGFPECIRDCRNAIRFVRKNAFKYNIDPERIGVMGGSAGGHLSLMVAMAPDDFKDGGPTPELKGISAKVCGAFSWIPVTDLARFWKDSPNDVVTATDGKKTLRAADWSIPNDGRPHLRSLFHSVTPESSAGARLYDYMSPVGHVSKKLPPLFICDGGSDPVIPGHEGKELYIKLTAVGADAIYWETPGGGHEFPSGAKFNDMAVAFLKKIFKQ